MSNKEKIGALVECSDQLAWALNSVEDIDSEDDKLTAIYWEIKDLQYSVDKYFKELTK